MNYQLKTIELVTNHINMSKQDIIENLAKSRTIEVFAKKFCKSPYVDDLCQDLYIALLEKPDDLIIELYEKKELIYYIRKMLRLNINSTTSPFYSKYEKFRKKSNNIEDEKNKI